MRNSRPSPTPEEQLCTPPPHHLQGEADDDYSREAEETERCDAGRRGSTYDGGVDEESGHLERPSLMMSQQPSLIHSSPQSVVEEEHVSPPSTPPHSAQAYREWKRTNQPPRIKETYQLRKRVPFYEGMPATTIVGTHDSIETIDSPMPSIQVTVARSLDRLRQIYSITSGRRLFSDDDADEDGEEAASPDSIGSTATSSDWEALPESQIERTAPEDAPKTPEDAPKRKERPASEDAVENLFSAQAKESRDEKPHKMARKEE